MWRTGLLRLGTAMAVAVTGLGLASCSQPDTRSTAGPPAAGVSKAARPSTADGSAASGGLLTAAPGGDGDSWRDTNSREYRLGLVNTPEYNECYGSAATAARKRLVAAGFRAQVYTTDTYGRSVAVVTTADGTNVNLWLARQGFANDRYLARYRHENPVLATALDAAFATAKRERAGLWGACR